MPPRIHTPTPLSAGAQLDLPAGAARHVQVLRLQPGDALCLFDGAGGQWSAQITRMGRSQVQVRVGTHQAIEREAPRPVHLLAALVASERMDWLVEKATELGAASLTPVLAERSSLRLSGERAEKKRAHWQAVAIAACEQCGRNRPPRIHPVMPLPEARAALGAADAGADAGAGAGTGAADHAAPDAPSSAPTSDSAPPLRWLLSLGEGAEPLATRLSPLTHATPARAVHLLSGPEGGWSPAEEAAARAAGFAPTSLGPRVLRAETAPLAVLSALTLLA